MKNFISKFLFTLLLAGIAFNLYSARIMYVSPIHSDYMLLFFREGEKDYSACEDAGAQCPYIWYSGELNVSAAKNTGTYSITSSDDANYSSGKSPTNIEVKIKKEAGELSYWIYLKLPNSLKADKTYTIDLGGLASNKASETFIFDVKSLRSESVHVNQIGYAPNAGKKVAYIYEWMGTGGGVDYAAYEGNDFYLVDANTNNIVYNSADHGKSLQFRKANTNENPGKPSTIGWHGTSVWECDFSEVGSSVPVPEGEYRLAVEGIGCSFPFEIRADLYNDLSYWLMRGFYHQRSGQARSSQYTRWPAPLHHYPGHDGFVITYSDWRYEKWHADNVTNNNKIPNDDPYAITGVDGGNFVNLPHFKTNMVWAGSANHPDTKNPHAGMLSEPDGYGWGGYRDAADADRRREHFEIPKQLLLLYEMDPSKFYDGELNFEESGNGLPDFLDEARQVVDLHRRLKGPSGKGCAGGVESENFFGIHDNDPSITKLQRKTGNIVNNNWYSYAEDQKASFGFAGMAAQLAYCLQLAGVDPTDDRTLSPDNSWGINYIQQAEEAYLWAMNAWGDSFQNPDPNLNRKYKIERVYADAALYRVTGDEKYLNDFMFYDNTEGVGWLIMLMIDDPALLTPALESYQSGLMSDLQSYVQNSGLNGANKREIPLLRPYNDNFAWGGYYLYDDLIKYIVAHHLTGDNEILDNLYATADFYLGVNSDQQVSITGAQHFGAERTLIDMLQEEAAKDGVDEGWIGGIPVFKYANNPGNDGNYIEPANGDNWPAMETFNNSRGFIQQGEYSVYKCVLPMANLFTYLKMQGGPVADFLSASPTSLNFTSSVDTQQVNISSNVNWTVSESAGLSWASVSVTSGSGNGVIEISVDENTGSTDRTGTVTLSGAGVDDVTIQLSQSKYIAELSATPTSIITSADAAAISVDVTSNINWTLSESLGWVTPSLTSGNGSATITLNIDENTVQTTRSGSITLGGPGVSDVVITIDQEAWEAVLSAAPSPLDISRNAGSHVLNITANVDWTISESLSWLSLDAAGGSGNGVVNVAVDANMDKNERTGTITLSANEVPDVIISVIQAGDSKEYRYLKFDMSVANGGRLRVMELDYMVGTTAYPHDMTSNNTPVPVVITSNIDQDAWKLYDSGSEELNKPSDAGYWSQVDLGDGNTIAPTEVVFTAGDVDDKGPQNFVILGSNDATNWDTLLVVENEAGWLIGNQYTFEIVPTSTIYTLDYSAGANGTISGAATQSVNEGGNGTIVEAVPNTGYTFDQWSDGVTDNPRQDLNVTGDISVTAQYTAVQYTLDVSATNATLSINPDNATYDHGETVVISITAEAGYQFEGWTGDASGNANPLSVIMDGNKSIAATMSQIVTYTLSTFVTNGSVSVSPDKANYSQGEEVTVLAVPNSGYEFTGWGGDLSGTTNPATIIIDGDKSVSAVMSQVMTYSLSTTATNGSISVSPDQTEYMEGAEVTLTAVPDPGYEFSGWSGDLSGSTNPVSITMDADKSITAGFTTTSNYVLNVYSDNGSITKNPDQSSYAPGTIVEVCASPKPGFVFDSWSGGATGTNSCVTVTMDGDKNLTANYTALAYNLNITANNGLVNANPAKSEYAYNETVVLTAMPNAGYEFTGWSGDLSGAANPVSIMMDGNKNITANFVEEISHLLSVNVVNGTVTVTPDKPTYTDGEVISLYVVPDAGYQFDGWGGDASGTATSTSVTMDSDKVVTANISAIQTYSLTISSPHGIVAKNPDKVSYSVGEVVDLTVVPAQGYVFDSWTGDLSGTAETISITMDANKAVTANYTEIINTYTLTVQADNATVTKMPDHAEYEEGETVIVSVIPDQGYLFDGWSGDASGTTNPVSVVMNGDKVIHANIIEDIPDGLAEKGHDIILYPNPASSVLNINHQGEISSVAVMNMLGQVRLSEDGNVESINIQNLPTGVYFLQIYHSEELFDTIKFIKE